MWEMNESLCCCVAETSLLELLSDVGERQNF